MRYAAILLFTGLFLAGSPAMPISGAEADTGRAQSENKDQIVIGENKGEKIITGDGNDNISGKGGDDFIESGNGNDLVSGGDGNDKIIGGDGDDYIIGGEGDDVVSDGAGSDYIVLGKGNDTFVYYLDRNKNNFDFAIGGEGDDTLVIVTTELDDVMQNEVIKYYEQQSMVGTDIAHLGKFDMALGMSQFEHVVFATSFAF